MLTAERKQQLILENARHEGDTGSPEVQIAVLSERIKYCLLYTSDAADD